MEGSADPAPHMELKFSGNMSMKKRKFAYNTPRFPQLKKRKTPMTAPK